jgi:two-component system, NtrC family, response regulator AtoC
MISTGPTEKTNARFTCLVIEDDKSFATMAAQVVREEGGTPTCVPSIASARDAVTTQSFDLVLLDNHLPDGKGYGFFEQLARRNPDAPIVMITGMPDLMEAITLTRNGLFEYLTKPISVEALVTCLQRVKLRLTSREVATEKTEFLGDSASVRELVAQLRQAAQHTVGTVLLTGETGVGKDLAARVLHQLTFATGEAPFVAVNCGAVPAEMFEAELFGAERGAYTGADKPRQGLVAAAEKGTLFLDEIGEVPLGLQPKLLRLLEAREYRALGSTITRTFSGRFVAATNKNLAEEVKTGRFREDLLYRLDVFSVEVPPLRQRRADIPKLSEALLAQLAKKYNRPTPLLKPEDLAALKSHDFPGNVRELRNVLERSLLRTDPESRWLAMDLNWLKRNTAKVATVPAAQDLDSLPPERDLSPLEAQEYRMIRDTIRQSNGGIRRTATKLGMSPQALLRRLEKWPELRISKVAV